MVYKNPSLPGYPKAVSCVDVVYNVQDVSTALNSSTQAQLLLFNGIEWEDGLQPSLSSLALDAVLGTWRGVASTPPSSCRSHTVAPV